MERTYKVKDLKQQLDALVEGADDMEIAFFLEHNGEILRRELYIPSMTTLVADGEVGNTVEVWLTEKKGDENDGES